MCECVPAWGNPRGVSPAKWPQAPPADLSGWFQRCSTNPCSRVLQCAGSDAIRIQSPPANCTMGSDHRVNGLCLFLQPAGIQSNTFLDHRPSLRMANRPAKRHLHRLCITTQLSMPNSVASSSTLWAVLWTKSIHGSGLPSGVLLRWSLQMYLSMRLQAVWSCLSIPIFKDQVEHA